MSQHASRSYNHPTAVNTTVMRSDRFYCVLLPQVGRPWGGVMSLDDSTSLLLSPVLARISVFCCMAHALHMSQRVSVLQVLYADVHLLCSAAALLAAGGL